MSSNRVSCQSRSFYESYEDYEDVDDKETEQAKYVDLYLTPQQALIINSKLPKMFSFQPSRKRSRRMINDAEEITIRRNERRKLKNDENNDSQANSNGSNLARKSERLVNREKIVYYDLDKVSSEPEKQSQPKQPQTQKEQSVKNIDNLKSQEIAQTKPQQSSQRPQRRSLSQKEPQHSQHQRSSKSQQKPATQQSAFQQEWRILKLIKGHTYAEPFLTPVDEAHDAAPNYYKIIKDPIDLRTIEQKLQANKYSSSFQFHSDLDKMWQNSYHFNKPKSSMHKLTKQIQRFHHNLMNICSSSPKPNPPPALAKHNKKQ